MKTRTKIMLLAGLLAALMWNGYVLAVPQDGQDVPPANVSGPSELPMRQGPGSQGMQPMMGGPGIGHGFSAPGMGQGPGGPDGIMGVIMHKLDLTDEQREKIETIMDENYAKTNAARRAVEKARRALEETTANDANEPVIRKAAAVIGNALGDEAVLKVKTMKEIKTVLTAGQITQLKEIQAKMKARGTRPGQDGQGSQKVRPMAPPPSQPSPEEE